MYAIIDTGGKQYRASPGDILKVEKLKSKVGDEIVFDRVLFASDGDEIHIGRPILDNAKVIGKIIRHGKGRKIIVFKYKRRKNYKRKKGHRQLFTEVKIEKIELGAKEVAQNGT